MQLLKSKNHFCSSSAGHPCQSWGKTGVSVPVKVNLELARYVNNRGAKKLMFKPQDEIKDPFAGK